MSVFFIQGQGNVDKSLDKIFICSVGKKKALNLHANKEQIFVRTKSG